MTTRQMPADSFGVAEERPRRRPKTRRSRRAARPAAAPQNYQQDPFAPTTQAVGAGLGALVGVAALGAVSNVLDDGFGGEDRYFEPKPDNRDRRNYNTDTYYSVTSEDIYLVPVGYGEPQRASRMETGGDPFGFDDTAPQRPMRRERISRQRDAYGPPPQQQYYNDPFGPTNYAIGAGLGAVVGLAALGAVSNVLSDGFGGEDQYFKQSGKYSDDRNYKENDYNAYESDTSPEDVYLNDYGEVGPQALNNLESVVEQHGREGLRVRPYEPDFDDVVDIMENNISASVYFEPDYNPGQVASIYKDGSAAYYDTEDGYFSGGNPEYESYLAEGVERFKREGELSEEVMVGPSEQFRGFREKYTPRFQTEQYGRYEDPDLEYRETYPEMRELSRTPLQDQYFQNGEDDNLNKYREYSDNDLYGNSSPEDVYLQSQGSPGPTAQRVLDSYYENRGGRPHEDFGDVFNAAATHARESFAVGDSSSLYTNKYDYTPVIFGDGSAIYVEERPQGFSIDEGSLEYENELKYQSQNEKFDIYSSTGEFFENKYIDEVGIRLGPDMNDDYNNGYGDDDKPTPPDYPYTNGVREQKYNEKYKKNGDYIGDNVRRNMQTRSRDNDNDVLMSEIARGRLARRMETTDSAERASERSRILDESRSFKNMGRSHRNSKDDFEGYVINDYESMDNGSDNSNNEPSFYRNGVAARAMGRT